MKDISLIIARLLLKVASPKEKEELEKWRSKSAENDSFYQTIQSYWKNPAGEEAAPDKEEARKHLLTRIQVADAFIPNRWNLFRAKRFVAAAIVFLVIGFSSGYLVTTLAEDAVSEWMEVSTEPGHQSHLTLPDGSHVWLNANTQLKYHSGKKSRRVELAGEAYFEVARNDKSPFIVETGETSVEVMGTSFNIAAYPVAPFMEASLLTGKIAFKIEGNPAPVYLSPGEKVVYNREDHTWNKFYSDVSKEALWRHGILVFEKENFERLIRKLENYYAVRFIYDAEQFKDMHYTGTISNLTISRVLEFINLTHPIEYRIDNHTIYLKPFASRAKRE